MGFVTKTLRSLPFGIIISGPMTAAIEAQALAAQSTVDFIRSVGFEPANETAGNKDFGPTRTVTFQYTKKKIIPSDGSGSTGSEEETVTLTVPILTIVPIPYIRIEELTIDFTAQVTSQHEDTASLNNTVATSSSINGKFGNFLSPVNLSFSGKVSTRTNTALTSKNNLNVQATIDIHLKAVQDEMPAGMAKMLNILEEAIIEKPTS